MLNNNTSVWDAMKVVRKPRTETVEDTNSISVDWDSYKTCRRPRNAQYAAKATELTSNNVIIAKVEEPVIINDYEEPGAMSLTSAEIRDMMRLA